MGELDYQMALLLQHRFEQEYKSATTKTKSDRELAKQLQDQFEQEQALEKPSHNLVYHQPKSSLNSSKCLTDPSWELVDPTPDIHNLFLAFNERFFWNKLLAVCVSWSKRMTTCAGICSYQGRGGMCSITLSEPLLKLRPRKDLVETLLHEMIHAYLFVTHNNRDRDGHGPEFHKHMWRINKESGTNITVYHDFHDEVRLYQQHWWRCDGPCQHRKPFFGMVRRATNRAPGPNDRWWAEHSRSCGGAFVKVKEPEQKEKGKTKAVSAVKSKDIRDFFPGGGSNNVKGFKDLGSKVKGKFNSASTIVVTKNSKTSTESGFKPTVFNAGASTSSSLTEKNCITSFKPTISGTSSSLIKKSESNGSILGSGTAVTDEFLTVRNHWANKFGNTAQKNKRPALESPKSVDQKIPKISEISDSAPDLCECPVCSKKVPMSNLNDHLDVCLVRQPEEEMKECPLCEAKIRSSIFDSHVEKCLLKVYDGVEDQFGVEKAEEMVSCLACGKKIVKSELNSHLDDCMIDIFDGDEAGPSKAEESEKKNSEFNCPFCLNMVEEKEMKGHIDGCLKTDDFGLVESLVNDF